MWGSNNACCILSVTAAKFLAATPKLFLEYLVLLLHLLHGWLKLQPVSNFAASLNMYSKQSKAFLAQWSRREQELSFSICYPKETEYIFQLWILDYSYELQIDSLYLYLPFQLQIWNRFLNLQSEQGRTMSANAFAFCLQTLEKKICCLHSGASFNPSFISLLHWREHYTIVSKKHNLVLHVFHIFCAINKKIRLFCFSFYFIILSYLIFICLHITILSLNVAKCHYFYCTNRAQRDKMFIHMGQC